MKLPKEMTTITSVSRLLAFLVFIVTPFIGFFSGIQYQKLITPVDLSESITNDVPTDPIYSPTSGQNDYSIDAGTTSNQKRFTSSKLGISFLFLNKYGNKNVLTKVVENKVYVYTADMKPEAGQSVEIFVKDPNTSFIQTLEDNFLKNYSKEFCYLDQDDYHRKKYSSNFETAELNFRKRNNVDNLENLNKCHPYTMSNGNAYFLTDKNHPDKFAYFSIGQYSIFAEEKFNADGSPDYGVQAWQDTFTFFK
jgi:hypothetical protein